MQSQQDNENLYAWVKQYVNYSDILPIPGDASARCYFRVLKGQQSYIAVNAPPNRENNEAFVYIAKAFLKAGLNVPEVLAFNFDAGFLLLSDLGDVQLLKVLTGNNVEQYYAKAMEELIRLQQCVTITGWQLPIFDRKLLSIELQRLNEWYLAKYLRLELTVKETLMLERTYDLLITTAELQPRVCVHRDYHSRNIMLLAKGELGLLDFQDAVMGPITYDLVSLLKDCYIKWPPQQVDNWLNLFWQQLSVQKRESCGSFNTFVKWFDWMGLQRHLKVLGIFSRLYLRDAKSVYLKDIPRVLEYVFHVCDKYTEFFPLKELLMKRVLPNESNDISSRAWQQDASTHG